MATPVIVTASFTGATATPAAGDTLLLAFSTNVVLASGAIFSDADVTLSGGASLGAVSAAPTVAASNSVQITLGSGVTFVPGTTTIVLSADNDAIGGANSAPTGGGDPIVIGASDGVAPTITNVTVAGIDNALNGTGAAGGTLQVPRSGWTIDLEYSDAGGIATGQTLITANVSVGTSTGTQPAGTNLRPFLTENSANDTSASYTLPNTTVFLPGDVSLTTTVVDSSGLPSAAATFSLVVKAFTDELQPFETSANASQVWFLDFSRDLESYSTSPAGSGVRVDVTSGGNSRSDFEDLLRILGLNSATPIANVSNGQDSNEVVVDRLKTNLLSNLDDYYTGANVQFTLAQPTGSFGSSSSVAYGNIGYSQISIAGASTSAGVLGLAIFDPSNTTQNDNTVADFSGSRLGVFLHTIVDAGMQSSSATSFRTTYDAFAAAQGGTPIGDDPLDASRLTGITSDARATAIDVALADLARFTATVTAHECGHSVGLVENGAMPVGLYGDDTTNFPGSSDGHIRNTSLFPSGSTNVMSPALSYTTATAAASAFNTLNMAYLREQVFYNGN
ncbi:MAG: hypothetical protein AB8H80_11100 [Planctomycetota bacterium]